MKQPVEPKLRREALEYHRYPEAGKIEVVPTKPYATPEDLSLAYSPGVAYPCVEIAANPDKSFDYTNRGNLVGVISNGTAVLGLGNIGPDAAKPVMEGKAMLFKIFAGIDAYDIELDADDPATFIAAVKALEPTFGGINLEDIKAPECFEIETELRKACRIPIMHDDQHGTAVITAAGMINALELQGKRIEKVRMVVNGAGAAAIACTNLLVKMGMKKDNIIMCDSRGAITEARTDLNSFKREYATKRTDVATLADAVRGADVFLGLSAANVLTADMLRSMAERPIVFALANPDPEISSELAHATRKDLIFATGRSDLPNQINNVLGFPYIFRGALDTRATDINDEMKLAAARAIASLAHEKVPQHVRDIYGVQDMSFGPDYILPKPFDRRLLQVVAPAVAIAAMDTGVARRQIVDPEAYGRHLRDSVGINDEAMAKIIKPLGKAS